MPRPRKSEKPLTQTAFRLTEVELDLVREAASVSEMSTSEWIRGAVTAVAGMSVGEQKRLIHGAIGVLQELAGTMTRLITMRELVETYRDLRAGRITQKEFDRKISADYAESISRNT